VAKKSINIIYNRFGETAYQAKEENIEYQLNYWS